MKINKTIIFAIIILTFLSCNKSTANAAANKNKKNTIIFKLSPKQIADIAQLENNILSKSVFLPNVIDSFKINDYYYAIGQSKIGNLPERKRASQLDGKRWAAIIMKYLLTGNINFNLKGEYVDFVKFEGEYTDNNSGVLYTIYKFRREQ